MRAQSQQDFMMKENTSKQKQGSNQGSFLTSTHQISLNIQDQNIFLGISLQSHLHFIQTAYNQTFIIRIYQKQIHHYSRSGALLKVLNFTDKNKLGCISFMPNNKTVGAICFNPFNDQKQNEIVQWNLQTYQEKRILFHRRLSEILFHCYFQQSNTYCMIQMGRFRVTSMIFQELKLTTIKFPLQNNNQKPYHVQNLEIPFQKKNKDFRLLKLNKSSLIASLEKNLVSTNQLQVLIYDLSQKQPQWQAFIFECKLDIDFSICSIKIVDIYEVQPTILYIKIGVEPDEKKLSKELVDSQPDLSKYEKEIDFIWNYRKGNVQRFNIGNQKHHFVQFIGKYRQFQLSAQQKPYVQAVRKIRKQNMRLLHFYNQLCQSNKSILKQMTIFYIDTENLEVKVQQKRQINITRSYQFCPITHNPQMLVEFYEDKSKKRISMEVKKLRKLPYKADLIYAEIITNIIQIPDEDLIYSVVNLLTDLQNQLEQWQWDSQQETTNQIQ